MLSVIGQFCNAYAEWDQRSNVGDVYLTPIMLNLGGHVRRGVDPHELGAYTVGDLRNDLQFLTEQVSMDAGFLVSSLSPILDPENLKRAFYEQWGE